MIVDVMWMIVGRCYGHGGDTTCNGTGCVVHVFTGEKTLSGLQGVV